MSASSLIRTRGKRMLLQSRTDAIDSGGGATWTWSVGTVVKVFMQPRSGSEAVRYGRENNREFGVGYMSASVTPNKTDRLAWTPAGGTTTRYFDIQSVRRPDERISGQSLSHIQFEYEETEP